MKDSSLSSSWSVEDGLFASKKNITDLHSFFLKLPVLGDVKLGKRLVIEPGSKVFCIQDGVELGEFEPGAYTIESFTDRFKIWGNKQLTVIVARAEDLVIPIHCGKAFSAESVPIEMSFEGVITIGNISNLLGHLMGSRDEVTMEELRIAIAPFVQQAAREIVSMSPVQEMVLPNFAEVLLEGIRSRIDVKLQRYGVGLIAIRSLSHLCDMDAVKDMSGEAFIREQKSGLKIAAAELGNERVDKKLGIYERRLELRSRFREVLKDDRLNKLKTEEEFKQTLLDIDRQSLLRKQEKAELLNAFNENKENREALQEHLKSIVDLERDKELEDLRVEIDHAARIKNLENEIEHDALINRQEKGRWHEELQRDREEAEHRFALRKAAVEAKWERVRAAREQKRADSIESILNEQRVDEIQSELEFSRESRRRKLALLESELQERLDSQKLLAERRKAEFENEITQQKSSAQLERLEKVQAINAAFAQQQQKIEVELEQLKASNQHKHELERLQAMGQMPVEALIATADHENAKLLADYKLRETEQGADQVRITSETEAASAQELARSSERINQIERDRADAVTSAYKEAMQAQQATVSQMISGLSQLKSAELISEERGRASNVPSFGSGQAMRSWHIIEKGVASAGMSLEQLHEAIRSGRVGPETLVWRTGMANWQPARSVAELLGLFGFGGGNPEAVPPTPPPVT